MVFSFGVGTVFLSACPQISEEIASRAARATLQPRVSPLPEACASVYWLTHGSGAGALTPSKDVSPYESDAESFLEEGPTAWRHTLPLRVGLTRHGWYGSP